MTRSRPRCWSGLMSELGQTLTSSWPRRRLPLYPSKQTSDGQAEMSVQCHKRTCGRKLFDHLVARARRLRRDVYLEHLSSTEIYEQLVFFFCWLLNGKIARFRASKNLVEYCRGTAYELAERLRP